MWTLAAINIVAAPLTGHSQQAPPPSLDVLSLFGFLASILTLLFWMHRRQSKSATAALAVCLLAMAFYGFMQGAWPLGIIEIVWSAATFVQLRTGKRVARSHRPMLARGGEDSTWQPRGESRVTRMFGSN